MDKTCKYYNLIEKSENIYFLKLCFFGEINKHVFFLSQP